MEFDIVTRNVTVLVDHGGSYVFDMDYDYKTRFMYFPRYYTHDIVRFAYPSKNITLQTVIQSLSSPTGIAVDSTNGHIYWCEYGTNRLSRCNLDGSNVTVLAVQSRPIEIQLDVTNSNTCLGRVECKCNQESSNLNSINCLARVEYTEENRLYWINYHGDILSAKDDGSNVKTILSTNDPRYYYAIRVIGRYIYYAHNNQLLMVTKTSGLTPTVLYYETSQIYSIFVFNQSDCIN
ncbi:unnamed protein product [Mytilus coruscus]|uniref:LRP5_6 n=1 Tax=Mytilus coruscus TaxID=42192 RepID=A0A6J8C997_MYTCO|nr:unnamed protein product [Mytilus coruscus]